MKKKNKKTAKATKKKKGFTLVELLAVIIILAIVVGISIPAVLTTVNTTRKKAFNTAAQSVADWVDRQYEVYTKGLDAYGVAKLDEQFKKLCIRGCGTNGFTDYAEKSGDLSKDTTDTDKKCSCYYRINYITVDFIKAAGLKSNNIAIGHVKGTSQQSLRIKKDSSGNLYAMRGNYTDISDTTTVMFAGDNETKSYTTDPTGKSRVYINAETGRSCVTLYANEGGDYPSGAVACGGNCTSGAANVNRPDYCEAK